MRQEQTSTAAERETAHGVEGKSCFVLFKFIIIKNFDTSNRSRDWSPRSCYYGPTFNLLFSRVCSRM